MAENKRRICTRCGTVAMPIMTIKGSIWIEIAMWLVFLLPGVIYSIWRYSTKALGCPACNSQALIPLNTPMARTILQAQNATKHHTPNAAFSADSMPPTPVVHDRQFTVAGVTFEVVTWSPIDDREANEIVLKHCRENKLDQSMAGSVQRIDLTKS